MGGNRGVNKTYNAIKDKYYWECMKEDIQYRQKSQRIKLKRLKTRQSMQITDTLQRALQKISMDLVGPLPMTSNSNWYILSIQDHLSRLVILAHLKD